MIARGDVWDVDLGPIVRPVVVVTRAAAIPVLNRLNCVAVTRTVRGHVAEVELTSAYGLDDPSFANCDWIVSVAKDAFLRRRGALDPTTARRLDVALLIALGLDVP